MELFIPIAAVFSALGNFLMKLSSSNTSFFSQIYFLLGGLSYLLNLFFFKKGLLSMPLSIGYPLLATLSIILSCIFALFLLGENLNSFKVIGIFFCCVGIILITR